MTEQNRREARTRAREEARAAQFGPEKSVSAFFGVHDPADIDPIPYATSFSSRAMLWSNVTGIKSATATFVYNHFTVDERVNERGLKEIDEELAELLDSGEINATDVQIRIPRYVGVNFDFYNSQGSESNRIVIGDRDLNLQSRLKQAMDEGKFMTEEELSSYDFRPYIYGNKQLEEVCDSFFRRQFTSFGRDESSPLQLLRLMSTKTTTDPDLLQSFMPDSLKGFSFNSLTYSSSPKFEKMERIVDVTKVNGAYAPYMFATAPMRGNLLYNLSSIGRLRSALDNRTEDLGSYYSFNEEVFNIPYTELFQVDEAMFGNQTMQHVGFIFEKYRIFDNKIYPMPSILVTDPSVRSFIDTEVAYGVTYEYRSRAIYEVKAVLEATGGPNDARRGGSGLFELHFFLASESSAPFTVDCLENRRPLPPTSLSFHYIPESDKLAISWIPAANPQRDVKYFQIFRREYIEQPFELIANFDFDNSIVREFNDEIIDPNLTYDLDFPLTFFEDSHFNTDSRFIYSIVSKDAHMNSSVLSEQFLVSYDHRLEETRVEFISPAGAPKHLPNYYLRREKFEKFPTLAKDSFHSKVKIIFDPECLSYVQSKPDVDQITPLVDSSNESGTLFKFQFVNMDKLEASIVDITVQDHIGMDKRTVMRTSNSGDPNSTERISGAKFKSADITFGQNITNTTTLESATDNRRRDMNAVNGNVDPSPSSQRQ